MWYHTYRGSWTGWLKTCNKDRLSKKNLPKTLGTNGSERGLLYMGTIIDFTSYQNKIMTVRNLAVATSSNTQPLTWKIEKEKINQIGSASCRERV